MSYFSHGLKKLGGVGYWVKVVIVGIVFGVGLQFAQAWTNPTAVPPNGNVAGPITTSVIDQYKAGALGIGGLLKAYSGIDAGNKPIIGLAEPVNASDAATKGYVDARAGSGGGGGAQGYSQDCSDFSAKGFSSEDECFRDGRWHLVYINKADGSAFKGDKGRLGMFVASGADVRVHSDSYRNGTWGCETTTVTEDGTVSCLESIRFSGDVIFPRWGWGNTLGAAILNTKGEVGCFVLPSLEEHYNNLNNDIGGYVRSGDCGTINMAWFTRF